MAGPGKAGSMKMRPVGPTQFRKFYERGDFPIAIEHGAPALPVLPPRADR